PFTCELTQKESSVRSLQPSLCGTTAIGSHRWSGARRTLTRTSWLLPFHLVQRHLEELLPRLAIGRAFADFVPLALLVEADEVAHIAELRVLHRPDERVALHRGGVVAVVAFGQMGAEAVMPGLGIVGKHAERIVNDHRLGAAWDVYGVQPVDEDHQAVE